MGQPDLPVRRSRGAEERDRKAVGRPALVKGERRPQRRVDAERGVIHTLSHQPTTDVAPMRVVAYRRCDEGRNPKPRETRRDVARETAHRSLERAYVLERPLRLKWIQVVADAPENRHLRRPISHGTAATASPRRTPLE